MPAQQLLVTIHAASSSNKTWLVYPFFKSKRNVHVCHSDALQSAVQPNALYIGTQMGSRGE